MQLWLLFIINQKEVLHFKFWFKMHYCYLWTTYLFSINFGKFIHSFDRHTYQLPKSIEWTLFPENEIWLIVSLILKLHYIKVDLSPQFSKRIIKVFSNSFKLSVNRRLLMKQNYFEILIKFSSLLVVSIFNAAINLLNFQACFFYSLTLHWKNFLFL